MINNRQAGRRRGRNNNNPRQNGGGNRGNGDSGNRIDSRARGNAVQLLEKYRNMARDAQLAGDRVNMEYYLQFADHYFRVLADNRARQEENQQRVRRFDETDQDDDFGDDGESFDVIDAPRFDDNRREDARRDEGRRDDSRRDEGRRDEGRRDDSRRERGERTDRDDVRRERNDDWARDGRRPQRERAPQPAAAPVENAQPAFAAPANDVVNEAATEEAPRPRATRARKPRRDADAAPELGLDSSILPPAIGRPVDASAAEEEPEAAPAPRRTRRPRSTPAQAAE